MFIILFSRSDLQKCRSRSKCIIFLGVQIDTIEKTEIIVKTNITIASSSCLRQGLELGSGWRNFNFALMLEYA